MRIMTNDIQTLRHLRATQTASSYVGKEIIETEIEPLRAQVSPVTDNISIALYGNKVIAMYALTCEAGTDIIDSDSVIIGGGKYKVISVMRYSQHVSAKVERVGADCGH